MRQLFDGIYSPIGEDMEFVPTDVETAKNTLCSWFDSLGSDMPYFQCKEETGDLEHVFKELQPMVYPVKTALIQCRNNWTAITSNPGSTGWSYQISKRLPDSYNLWTCAKKNAYGKTVNGWGGGCFRLDIGNREYVRNLMLSQQNGWLLDNNGNYLDFEQFEKYTEKLQENRFTAEMLEMYMKHYGIELFNEDFYMPPNSKAYIIEHKTQPFEKQRSLAELRKILKYE